MVMKGYTVLRQTPYSVEVKFHITVFKTHAYSFQYSVKGHESLWRMKEEAKMNQNKIKID
jgi:hypothetical protein